VASWGHQILLELYYASAWHPVDQAVLHEGAGIATYRGYAEEMTVRACELRVRILDDLHTYDPDNPLSPLYGLIGQPGQRTPARLSVNNAYEVIGEVASWRPGASDDWMPGPPVVGFRYVDVSAFGVLRRLSQWTRQVQSPLRRELASSSSWRGYWPCEDTAGTVLVNLTPAGLPADPGGATLQGSGGADGSGPILELPAGATPSGRCLLASSQAGWQFGWLADASEVTLAGVQLPTMAVKASNGVLYQWWVTATDMGLTVTSPDGVNLLAWSIPQATWATVKQFVWHRLAVTVAGSTVTVSIVIAPQGAPANYAVNQAYTFGTIGYPATWLAGPCTNLHVGHVIARTGTTDELGAPSVRQALSGYVGETAAARFTRLCTQEGIACQVIGDPTATQPMGPQGVDALFSLLKEGATTEDGLLFEDRDTLAVVMRTRRSLYAAPVLTLTYPDDLGKFAPVTDDLETATVVTVKGAQGGEATATAPGAAADTQAERRDVAVNVANELQLPALADYWVNRLSQSAARYPQVVVDVDRSPTVGAAAAALEPGDVITVAGYRPNPIRLMVLGSATSTLPARRLVTLTTVPADQYHVAVYGDAGSRYDIDTCTVAAAITASAVSVPVTCAGATDAWSTTAVPYVWTVGAEQVRVTAMTAPVGGPAGSAPRTQTATVVRGVNGVARAHTAGEPVRLADPVYYGR
jgi:hypothetical protein